MVGDTAGIAGADIGTERFDAAVGAVGRFQEGNVEDGHPGAAFGQGRGKASGLISGGSVSVNYQVITKPDHMVSEGDRISCRGLGKICLTRIKGTTKKGRISVTLERYR